VNEVIRAYHDAGVRHIVALRGDPSAGRRKIRAHPGGYQNGAIWWPHQARQRCRSVGVPSGKHPDSPRSMPISTCSSKVDAGAARAITQFFFGERSYFRYLDRVRARGITGRSPRILPVRISSRPRASRSARRLGAGRLAQRFDGLDDDPADAQADRAAIAANRCSTWSIAA